MRIWIISDTHMQHKALSVPKNIDMVIHCGDSTNYYDEINNNREFIEFENWWRELPVKNKVIIAGNHDHWATRRYNIDKIKEYSTYLEHEECEISNIKIFGSPYTPTYGDWYFMKPKDKMFNVWESLPDKIDILITHGPPQGILDLSENRQLQMVGDKSLFDKVLKIKPEYHCFGHIHNNHNCYNQGIRKFKDITFINASCVTDGKINQGVSSNGVVIEIKI